MYDQEVTYRILDFYIVSLLHHSILWSMRLTVWIFFFFNFSPLFFSTLFVFMLPYFNSSLFGFSLSLLAFNTQLKMSVVFFYFLASIFSFPLFPLLFLFIFSLPVFFGSIYWIFGFMGIVISHFSLFPALPFGIGWWRFVSPGFWSWNFTLYEILYNQCFIPGTSLYRRRVIRGIRVLLLPSDQRGVSFPLPHLFVFWSFCGLFSFLFPCSWCLLPWFLCPYSFIF